MPTVLASRLASAPAGSTIDLEAGDHRLDASLEITAPITIRGAGADVTRIVGAADDAVIRIAAAGTVTFSALTVAREEGAGLVLMHDEGELLLDACRVTGGTVQDEEAMGDGAGLVVRGEAVATLQGCTIDANAGPAIYAEGTTRVRVVGATLSTSEHGVQLDEEARIEILDSTLADNGTAGVAIMGDASAVVRNSACTGGQVALYAGGSSKPAFEKTRVSGAAASGFLVKEASSATLVDVESLVNQACGVLAQGEATVTVEGGLFAENQYSGVVFAGASTGSVTGARCAANAQHGISVDGAASPRIQECVCEGNQGSGVGCAGTSRAVVSKTRCKGNANHGILTLGNASSELEGNELEGNAMSGLAFQGEATGQARGNVCRGNETGVTVAESAAPVLEDNEITDHPGYGLDFDDDTAGEVRRNRSLRNRGGLRIAGHAKPVAEANELASNRAEGILVSRDAAPELLDNRCADNGTSGIAYYFSAAGIAKGNRCERNKDHGILVVGTPTPAIEENSCTDNGGRGIALEAEDGVRPKVKLVANVCERNAKDGGLGDRAPWPLVEQRLSKTPLWNQVRRAWLPEVEEGDGPLTASKFGGRPWLSGSEKWPACGHCKKPMPLVVQLEIAKLPEPLRDQIGHGLVQVFYCKRDTCADSENHSLCRLVSPSGAASTARAPKLAKAPPALQIVRWLEFGELPSWHELEALHLPNLPSTVREAGFSYNDGTAGVEASGPAIDAHLGDKLGGWPRWIQHRAPPACPICGAEMTTLVFQIDEEDHVPWTWGDAGAAYVMQCPTHKEALVLVEDTH
ncbi:MAG: right-handed parallel beta-helix repeat-containing protein [Deltaproteobacteria bacterium]|nr:right-handed parallel beta-helix repeat-containing protein [Deltaproteobacteria bacterium]